MMEKNYLSKQEIVNYFTQTDISEIPLTVTRFKNDGRKFVTELCVKYEKKYALYLTEKERLFEMSLFERELYKTGYKFIGGTDEVGRGPLAGPVAACIVILPEGFTYPGINDSKKVPKKNREALSIIIKENAVDFAIGIASVQEIDEINILNATKTAMARAYNQLKTKPDFLLADAIEIPEIPAPQKSIIGGDAKSISIAAASIVAKVYRDKLMDELNEKYPQYGFNSNKGYGSREHIDVIKKYGPSPVHRKTFIRSIV